MGKPVFLMVYHQAVYIYITSILIQQFWGTLNSHGVPGIQLSFLDVLWDSPKTTLNQPSPTTWDLRHCPDAQQDGAPSRAIA